MYRASSPAHLALPHFSKRPAIPRFVYVGGDKASLAAVVAHHYTLRFRVQRISSSEKGHFMYVRFVMLHMARRPKIREKTADALDSVCDEHEYGSFDEAISHVLRECGYNV